MQYSLFYISLSTLKHAFHFIALSFTAGETLMVLTITYCPCYCKVAFTYSLLTSHCSLALTVVLYESLWKGINFYSMPWRLFLGILTIYSYLPFFLLNNYLSLEVYDFSYSSILVLLQAFVEGHSQEPFKNLSSLYQSDHPHPYACWPLLKESKAKN